MKRLLLVLLLAGCPARQDPAAAATDAAIAATGLELRGADGKLTLVLSPSGGGYVVEGASSGRIETRGDGLALVDGDVEVAAVRGGAAGPVLTDASGTVLARVYSPTKDTYDLLQPDGVALLRTSIEAGVAVARDKAGGGVATARRDGAVWELDAPNGTRLASVAGTDDPIVALVLALPALPAPVRAVAAAHAAKRN